MPDLTHDILVIGHGLAGSVLVHELHKRSLRFHVFDAPRTNAASIAAAGMVNPISLRRDVLTWRAPELLRKASLTYSSIEKELGKRLWHPLDLVKIFPTPHEADQWQRARKDPSVAEFLLPGSDEASIEGIATPHGHGIVKDCGWLDLRSMLKLQRERLIGNGDLSEIPIEKEQIVPIKNGHAIGERSAPWLVDCTGPFSAVPGLVPVKGEVLTVKIPDRRITHIFHRKVFVLPIGGDLFRVGATYAWNDVWSGPSAQAREHLLDQLNAIVDRPIEVLEHRAGVRPAARDRRPILGTIAPHRAVFNGLGSRGVLLAPWCAEHLLDHLFDRAPIDPEAGLSRFKP